jgi:hypothetical protein
MSSGIDIKAVIKGLSGDQRAQVQAAADAAGVAIEAFVRGALADQLGDDQLSGVSGGAGINNFTAPRQPLDQQKINNLIITKSGLPID